MLAGGVLLTSATAAGYLWRTAPVYEAAAALRVDPRRGTLPTVYTPASDESGVASEVEVLRSRSLAARVTGELGLQLQPVTRGLRRSSLFSSVQVHAAADTGRLMLLAGADGRPVLEDRRGSPKRVVLTPGAVVRLSGLVLTVARSNVLPADGELVVRRRSAVEARLAEDVQVMRAGLETTVIGLRYRDADPALAREVLDAWIDAYLAGRQTSQHAEASSTATVLRGQIDTLTRELSAAEDVFRAYRERAGTVDPQSEATTQIGRLATLQAERSSMEAERASLAALVSEVRAQADVQAGMLARPAARPETGAELVPGASPYRRLLGFPTLLRNPAAGQLLATLAQAEAARAELLVRRTPADPDVARLTERVREVEQQVGALATTYLEGLTAQVAASDRALAAFGAQLDRVPGQQVEYARLERQPVVLAQLVSTLQLRLKEAQVAEAIADPTVQIIDRAWVGERPAAPRPPVVAALALFVGLVGGGVGALLRERRDGAVRSRADVVRAVAAPLLGVIPRVASGGLAALAPGGARPAVRALSRARGEAPVAQAAALVDDAYTRLQLALRATERLDAPIDAPRVLLVTSAAAREGKSTTAVHLALGSARRGLRTLLVDADLRRGVLAATLLRTQPVHGLAQLLEGTSVPAEAIVTVEAEPGVVLDLLPAGRSDVVANRRLLAPTLGHLLATWRSQYDAVIVDSPPVGLVSDAAVFARWCDGVLLVAREGVTSAERLAQVAAELRAGGAQVVGSVLNAADEATMARDHAASYAYLTADA